MNTMSKTLIALSCSVTMLSGCATDNVSQRAAIGTAAGAVIGGVLGHQSNDKNGRYVGAAAGAAAGAAIGVYMDKQQREMEDKLAAEQRASEIELERVQEDTIKLNLNSQVSFATNSAELNTNFYDSLNKIASIISEYDETTVRVIGHTDSSGAAEHNQQLSLRRAESVSSYLARKGVSFGRISVNGRGEDEPRADNASDAGRAANRRVEIFLKSKPAS